MTHANIEKYTYLGTMSAEDSVAADIVVSKCINRLPFTLSFPVKKLFECISNKEYGRGMNYCLDFFEISVLWLSSLLLKRLIDKCADGLMPQTAELQNILNTIDTKRPLSFGDSLNNIFIPLANLSRIYIKDDALVESIATHLMHKNTCILLGNKNEPSVVQIRNHYKGHSTMLSEEIYKNVILTLIPRTLTLLKALEPLTESNVFSFHNDKKLNHNGADAHTLEPCKQALENGHYYIKTGDVITDLYPLIYCSKDHFVYVFQTLKDEKISYISSNENAITLVDDEKNEDLDRLIQRIQPSFDITREMNWIQIREFTNAGSKKTLSRTYSEKKYNRELFVDRVHLSDAIKSFYSDREKTIFPLLGEAGQGKTNQLCYWVEQLLEQNECVLFMQSSDFSSMTLENYLKLTFNISPRKNIGQVIDNIHNKAEQSGCYMYIFFDAINECLFYPGTEKQPGPLGLYNDIIKLLANKQYTHFKILFTCRNYTWKHLLNRESEKHREFIFSDDNKNLEIRGFTNEELCRAYSVYRELYQMETDFEDLSSIAKIRMRDPLTLKIACTNYLGQPLPEATQSYTSISLFQNMLKDIASSYAGRKQCDIIKHLGEYILNHYEQGNPVDNVPENLLHNAYNAPSSPLHSLSSLIYKADGTTIAYGELINKPERPILRIVKNASTNESQIQFIYERFLEYIMGAIFVEREERNFGSSEPIPAERYVEVLRNSATNAVYMGAMRNAIVIDISRKHNYQTIIDLTRDHSDNYDAMLLVNDVCNVLVSENYENDLFALIDQLLQPQIPNEARIICEFNETIRLIENNQADKDIMARHRNLKVLLMPVIRLRKLAIVNTINGILLTDYFNFGLYSHNPYDILWRLMNDPIVEISNDACMYTYYLSKRDYTINYTQLNESLTEKIVSQMLCLIRKESLLKSLLIGHQRKRILGFIETAVRLTVLLIIDTSLSKVDNREEKILKLLGDIRELFSYLTINGILVKMIMPVFKIVLRKQITFQSNYVNNAIEYQGFWQEDVVPRYGTGDVWSREQLRSLLPLINYATVSEKERSAYAPLLDTLHTALIAAYHSGDSFSYFVLERLMVIIGVCDWECLRPVIYHMLSDEYREKSVEWYNYSQMSLLYVLYQIGIYSKSYYEILELYSRNAEDWTRRCIGTFKARNSHKANASGLYKRNVMSWYCVIYCSHIGDGKVKDGDTSCVPLFYKLIDDAIINNDKKLLAHLIENISEIVTDWGYINTALQLLYHIMYSYDSEEKISTIDDSDDETSSIVALIGNVLSTAKNYFPAAIDSFIKQDITGLSFPGISTYKEEILSYNPSGESLSDLLTHKFGNYLMWSLLNEKYVTSFAYEAIDAAIDKKDCWQWYDYTVKLLFRNLFNVKI